jgi:hypothetical protein
MKVCFEALNPESRANNKTKPAVEFNFMAEDNVSAVLQGSAFAGMAFDEFRDVDRCEIKSEDGTIDVTITRNQYQKMERFYGKGEFNY